MKKKTKKSITILTFIALVWALLVLIAFFNYKKAVLMVYLPSQIHTPLQPSPVSQEPTKYNMIYGVNVDMSQILPTSPKYVKNNHGEDLIDIAHRLGINTFRITSITRGDPKTSIYSKTQWDSVFDKMKRFNMKAIILAESPELNPNDFSKSYLDFVKQYIIDSQIPSNPAVYAIDIRNEPLITDNNIAVLNQAAQLIKDKYPHILLTVGGWKSRNPNASPGDDPYIWDDPTDGQRLENIVDFYSIHVYGYDKPLVGILPDPYNLTQYYTEKIHAQIPDKSILIEEFGAGNGTAITDQQSLGSPELQAKAYNGVYQAINDLKSDGVIGAVSFDFLQRDSNPDGWSILGDNGNTIYPAAYVLQKYATGQSDMPLNMLAANPPQNYLVTTSDSGRTITVHKDDRIGLMLKLDKNMKNLLSLSDNSILSQTEPLTPDDSTGTFNAVLHALNTGSATLNIIQTQNCTSSIYCQPRPNSKLKVTIQVAP